MELKNYKEKTKKLKIKLRGGDVLPVEYFVNYLTVDVVEELNEVGEDGHASRDTDQMTGMLTHMLKSVDVTLDGNALPFDTKEEKEEALKNFTFDDILTIISKVREDIEGETKNASTGSVDG